MMKKKSGGYSHFKHCLSPADSKSRGGDIEFPVDLYIRFFCVCLFVLLSEWCSGIFPASICVSLVFCCKFVHIAIMLLYTLNIRNKSLISK